MNKKITFSILFILLIQLATATISGVSVDPGYNQVIINWTSGANVSGAVYYGVGFLTNVFYDGVVDTKHGVLIPGLIPETSYTYRIESGTDFYPSNSTNLNFTTDAGGIVSGITTSSFNTPVDKSANETITLTGSSNSNVRVQRNLDGIWYDQSLTVNGVSTFTYFANGDFNISISLIEGMNNLRIDFIDPVTSSIERQEFNIFGDFTPPEVDLAPLPSWTKGTVRLIGVIEPNSTMKVSVDGSTSTIINSVPFNNVTTIGFTKLGFRTEDMDYFNTSITISGDGEHNVTFVVRDTVGNEATFKRKISVDTQEPIIEKVSIQTISRMVLSLGDGYEDDMWTPYNPVTLEGFAIDEAGSDKLKVYVINLRNYTSNKCDDYRQDLIKTFIDMTYNLHFEDNIQGGFDERVDAQLNVFGTLFGNAGVKISPDSDGEFSTNVNLMSPNMLRNETEKDNNICILAVDRAGNVVQMFDTIIYEPTSAIWGVDNRQSDPNEIYSSWLKHNDYPVSVAFDLVFKDGREFSKVSDLNIVADLVDDGIDQIGKKIHAIMGETDPVYVKDESISGYHVYIPYFIMQEMDANTILYEQDKIQFSIKLEIRYKYDGKDQPEQKQFTQAVFSVETPYDVSKFLTPELVNDKLLPLFNETRNVLVTMSNFTRDYLIQYTLPVCAGMMAINTVGSFFSGGSNDGLIKAMKLVCDRVFSPTVPPKGPNFKMDKAGKITDMEGNPVSDTVIDAPEPDAVNKNIDDLFGTGVNTDGQRVATKGIKSDQLGIYRKGTIFKPNNIPCNPVIFGTGSATSIMLSSAAESSVYLIKEKAEGTSDYRCYNEQTPSYDNYKCWYTAWQGPMEHELNPMHDWLDSVRCGSFSGFYLQTERIIRHVDKIIDCLESIEEGLLDAGYCEQILSTSACEAFTWVFEKVVGDAMNGKGFGPKDGVGKLQFEDMMDSYEQAISRVVLSEGESGNYLHSMCMLAFGADASNFDVFLDNFLAAQDRRPTIGPVFVQSQMNSYNENTGELQIQYKYSPYIMAGRGSDVSASIELYCSSDGDDLEFCPQGEQAHRVIPIGLVPKGTTYTDTVVFNDVPAKVWYNKARITYSFNDVAKDEQVIDSKQCISKTICDEKGGTWFTGQMDGCTGMGFCNVRTLQSTTKDSVIKQETEPSNIIHRGGVRFGCTFDINTHGGFYCGYGSPTANSAQMEFTDIFMSSTNGYNPESNIDAFLTLNKRNFGKKDFIVSYEIKNTVDQKVVKSGAKKFSATDAFECKTEGVEGTQMQPKIVLPFRLLDGQLEQLNFKTYGIMATGDDLTLSDDILLTFKKTTLPNEGNNQIIALNKLIIKNEKGETFTCNINKDLNIVESPTHIGISNPIKLSSLLLESDCRGIIYNELFDDEMGEIYVPKFNKITDFEIYITKVNKDTNYALDVDTGTTNKPIISITLNEGAASASIEGDYLVDFELYYCKNSADGSCGDVTSKINDPSEQTYGKIVYGDSSNNGKMTTTYSIRKRDGCGLGPQMQLINPLENIYISNKVDKEFTLSIYDDCKEINETSFELFVNDEKKDSQLNSKNGLYTFKLPAKAIEGYSNEQNFKVKVSLKDKSKNVGNVIEKTYAVSTGDNPAYECKASSVLQGNGITSGNNNVCGEGYKYNGTACVLK